MDLKEVKYESKTKVTLEEFQKACKAFPGNYWSRVIRAFILTWIYMGIMFAYNDLGNIYFGIASVVVLFIILIYCKISMNFYAKKMYEKIDTTNDVEFTLKFYEDCLEKTSELRNEIIKYDTIKQIIETRTNFYILTRYIIIIEKNNCSEELCEFIRGIKKDKYIDKTNKKESKRNPKKIEVGMIILFILTILSFSAAVNTLILVQKYRPGNEWIIWIWLIIPVLSIILGVKYKKEGFKTTKNIVAGVIVTILYFAFVFMYAMFLFFDYLPKDNQIDITEINKYQDIIDIEIPSSDASKTKTDYKDFYFNGNMSSVIENNIYFAGYEKGFNSFEKQMDESNKWIIGEDLSSIFAIFTNVGQINEETYYMFYNETLDEYNTLPKESGNYHIYSITYDKEEKLLKIIDSMYEFKK